MVKRLGWVGLVAFALCSFTTVHAQEPVRRSVHKGKILLRNLDGSVVPFTQGRVGLLNADGRMIDSVAVQWDGTYKFNMENKPHTIQVLVHGYNFTPSPLRFNPRGPGDIPTITATEQRPGSTNRERLPDPQTGSNSNNNPTVINGVIAVSLKPHNNTVSRIDLANRYFTVKDADTGRLLSTIRTNAAGQFRYNEVTGRRVTIEAKEDGSIRYIPPKMTTTVPRGTANVEFVYYDAGEVGTGNLNVAKERTNIPQVLEPTIELKTHPHGVVTGHEIRFVAGLGRDKALPSFRYTFLLRYDYDRNWRIIANQQRSPELLHKLADSGGFAFKVIVYTDGAALGSSREGRAISLVEAPPPTSSTQRGHARMPSWKELIPFPMIGDLPPGISLSVRVGIDSQEGQVGLQRWIRTGAFLKDNWKDPAPQPRDGARVTFLVRHETDNEWTIVTRNSRTLEWGWTPDRPGKWKLRVDYMESSEVNEQPMHARAQIDFTAYTRRSDQNQGTSRPGHNTQSRPSEGLRGN